MTGLDKILKHIEENASAAADKIIADAKASADEILANAKFEGEQKKNDILAKSEADVKNILTRAASTAEIEEKKRILFAKQSSIEDILNASRLHLINLPDEDYFKFIKKMIDKFVSKETGEIIFNRKDLERLPKDFGATLASNLKVSSETRNIDGGFILLYGDIEENCSFSALFMAEKENLQDKVRDLLFC